ncbi:hypothetical protein [Mycobacterium kansasii]|uniref:hypothetical protein n=1 Tax=Mycobacterium kansasii TaxID=1768 RepID=UPI001158C598|nr:hypothetical protein [Mycobacterium kansasii]
MPAFVGLAYSRAHLVVAVEECRYRRGLRHPSLVVVGPKYRRDKLAMLMLNAPVTFSAVIADNHDVGVTHVAFQAMSR